MGGTRAQEQVILSTATRMPTIYCSLQHHWRQGRVILTELNLVATDDDDFVRIPPRADGASGKVLGPRPKAWSPVLHKRAVLPSEITVP